MKYTFGEAVVRNLVIVGIFALTLSACDSDPDCGEYAATQKVSEIMTEHQPNKLTDYVITNSPQFNQKFPDDDDPKLSALIKSGSRCQMLISTPIPEPGSQMYNAIQTQGGIDKYMASRRFCESLYAQISSALKTTVYSLSKIRTSAIDHDTKAVSCVADLNLDIPKWGSATLSNVKFSVEKTSEGEKIVTVSGLN